MDFLGLCGGQSQRPCHLAWSSSFSIRAAAYPSNLLPTNFSAWYLNVTGSYSFGQTLLGAGTSFGEPLVGDFLGTGAFAQQSLTLNPISNIVLIFAKTQNNLNLPYKVLQSDLDLASKNNGIAEISLDQYIFEFIGITDKKIDALTESSLTQNEIDTIKQSNDNVPDYIFRKIIQNGVAPQINRFVGITENQLAISYRLDNNTALSANLFATGAIGNMPSIGYRDAASKIVQVNLSGLKAGDTIYFHFVGVVQHYFRQLVAVRWSLNAQSSPAPDCAAYPIIIQAVNYKLYTWDIDVLVQGKISTQSVTGWRAVEAFNVPTWTAKWDLTNALYTSALYDRDATFKYPNTQTETLPLANAAFMPKNVDALNDRDAQEHIYFNVSPEALKKPDTYKIGVEASIANEIQNRLSDVNLKFPFFDDTRKSTRPPSEWNISGDPSVKTTTVDNVSASITPTSYSFLNAANFKIDPVKQQGTWSLGNAEVTCGVGQSPDNVVSSYIVDSPYILENLDVGTSILVEREATYGATGNDTLSIESTLTANNVVSCISNDTFATEAHTNADGYLTFNTYDNTLVRASLEVSQSRPDLAPPKTLSVDPKPSDYFPIIGYSGLLGDVPGYYDGRTVSTASSVSGEDIIYAYTDPIAQKYIPLGTNSNNLEKITDISYTDTTITLKFSSGICNNLYLMFKPVPPANGDTVSNTSNLVAFSNGSFADQEFLIAFKNGTTVVAVVDSLTLGSSMNIPVALVNADSLEITGSGLAGIKIHALIIKIKNTRLHDFLQDILSQPGNPFQNLRGIVFKSGSMTIAADSKSNLYFFFVDAKGNISAVYSSNFGVTWFYFYAVVPYVSNTSDNLDYKCQDIFSVNDTRRNITFLFFLLGGKLFCKPTEFSQFVFNDCMTVPSQNDFSSLSVEGQNLRKSPSFFVCGKIYKDNSPSKDNIIDIGIDKLLTLRDVNGNKKYPYAVAGQYLTNEDLSTGTYTAYYNQKGVLKCLYNRNRNGISYLFWKISYNDAMWWLSAQNDEITQGQMIHGTGSQNIGKSVSSLYSFYKANSDQIFLFYTFNSALFCKIVPEHMINNNADLDLGSAPCYFVDGIISNELAEDFTDKVVPPIGFGIHKKQAFIDNFNIRSINPQRVCAYNFGDGYVRVLYKNSNNQLRAAIFMANMWFIEDMMRSSSLALS